MLSSSRCYSIIYVLILFLLTIANKAGGTTSEHVAIFNNSEIRFVHDTTDLNAQDAINACEANNSHLIDVKNLEIQNFLIAEIPKTSIYVSGTHYKPWDRGFITGGSRQKRDGDWMWMDGTLINPRGSASFSNWIIGRADHYRDNQILLLSVVSEWYDGKQRGEISDNATGAWFMRGHRAPSMNSYICQSFCLPGVCQPGGNCSSTSNGFQCQYADCTDLPEVGNGTAHAPNAATFPSSTVVTYECNHNYSFSSSVSTTATCTHGVWLPLDVPACFRDCTDLPEVGNGTAHAPNTTTFPSSTVVTYECNHNYSFSSSVSTAATCTHGVWLPPDVPACFRDCLTLPRHMFGNVTASDVPPYRSSTPPATITYQCDPDFMFDENATTTATCSDGRWLPATVPMCFQNCFSLPSIRNGRVNASLPAPYPSSYPATNLTFSCDANHSFDANATTEGYCKNGMWIPSGMLLPICHQDCLTLPRHMFGNVTASDVPPYRSSTPPSTITYQCDPDFMFDENATTTATRSDGRWLPATVPMCFQSCFSLPSIRNGRVNASLPAPYPSSYPATNLTFSCDANHSFDANATTEGYCKNGMWIPSGMLLPICHQDCLSLPTIANGRAIASKPPPYRSSNPATTLTFECDKNYTFDANATTEAVCTNGMWIAPGKLPPTCYEETKAVTNGPETSTVNTFTTTDGGAPVNLAALMMALPDSLGNKSSEEVTTMIEEIERLVTSDNSSMEAGFVVHVANFVRNISEAAESDLLEIGTEALTSIAKISSNIMSQVLGNITSSALDVNQTEYVQSLFTSLNSLSRTVSLEDSEVYVQATENFVMQAQTHSLANISFSLRFSPYGRAGMSVEIPGTALEHAGKGAWKKTTSGRQFRTSESSNLRSIFFYYRTANLFAPGISKVVAAGLSREGRSIEVENLPDPVLITMPDNSTRHGKQPLTPTMVTRTKLECVFWDERSQTWSSKGCCLQLDSNPPECRCNHLASFTVIADSKIVAADVVWLPQIFVGCSFDIVCIAVTMVTYLTNKDIMKSKSLVILFLNACANLIVGLSGFMVGFWQTEIPTLCLVFTILLQFFNLSTWCSLSAYICGIYISLYGAKAEEWYLSKILAMTYGTPLLITAVNLVIFIGKLGSTNSKVCGGVADPLTMSSYRADNMCWLSGNSRTFGYLLPVALLLILNLVFFLLAASELKRNKQLPRNESRREPTLGKSTVSFANQSWKGKLSKPEHMGIFGLLISTTSANLIAGYFVIRSDDVRYFRTVTNTMFMFCTVFQGVALFVVAVVRKPNVWKTSCLRHVTGRNRIRDIVTFASIQKMRSSLSGGLETIRHMTHHTRQFHDDAAPRHAPTVRRAEMYAN